MQAAHTVRAMIKRTGQPVQPEVMGLLQAQQPTEFGRYGAKTGEALNIVDQMKALGETFAADKQSAIDEENRLQELYTNLMKEKTELLNSLIKERDERQGILNQVNQDIA